MAPYLKKTTIYKKPIYIKVCTNHLHHKTFPDEYDYCPICGRKLKTVMLGVKCPKCGQYYPLKTKYCAKCGAKLPKPSYRWGKAYVPPVF